VQGSDSGGQPFQPTEVAALAEPYAGDKETHRTLLRLQGHAHTESIKHNGSNRSLVHSSAPFVEWPDITATMAAYLAHEPRLEIGRPDMIRPLVCADRDRMTAMIVGKIKQDTAHARGAHFAEGDLL